MEISQCRSGGFSGGLEETYTDFDAWVTRRWNHRHRPYHRPGEDVLVHPNRKPNTIIIDLQDSIVNGLCHKKSTIYSDYTEKDLYGLRRFCRQNDNWTNLDFVMIRLLRENGRRRLLLLNKSKL